MWNMPSIVPGMPPPVALTLPLCQKPPRSAWLSTVLVTVPPGPIGVGIDLPSHVQLPSNTFRFAISAAGAGAFGGASSAKAQGTATARVAVASRAASGRVVLMANLLVVVRQ